MKNMMNKIKSAALLTALCAPQAFASGMINTGGFDAAKYCLSEGAPRQTYLVIDTTSIPNNSASWAQDIMQTLPPSYLPSEEIGIYYLSPNGDMFHVFTTCFPNVNALESGGLLRAAPERVIRDDMPKLTRLMQRGLGEAMQASTHTAQPDYDRTLPEKDLARSLFQVTNDIRLNSTPIRLVVYSDGIQNSSDVALTDLSDSDAAKEAGIVLADKHSANFNNATVYFHGIDSTGVRNAHLAAFWESYLQASAGHLKSFSSNLPGMNRTQYNMLAISDSYSGVIKSQGVETLFKLRIERPEGLSRGEINQAFASINGYGMMLNGSFETKGNKVEYKLEIVQHHSGLDFESGDSIVLTESGQKASGFIGDLNPSTMQADTNNKFQFDLVLEKDNFLMF